MNTAIWLLFVQALLGAFDTLYYHEYRLRLPHAHGTRTELRLHASRDFAYATIIGSLGFLTWNGLLAWALCALLLAEIGITIWDFIEEDRIRRLPGGERAMHAVMGIVYGAFLAYLIPEILHWSASPTGFGRSYHGFLRLYCPGSQWGYFCRVSATCWPVLALPASDGPSKVPCVVLRGLRHTPGWV